MPEIAKVAGTITLLDGTTSQFSITSEGVVQWGATKERLGESVDALGVMHEALLEAEELEAGT